MTAATGILAAGLVLVHHPVPSLVRNPAPAQAPPAGGTSHLRRTTDTTALGAILVSATKRTKKPPPANVIIVTPTLPARALPRTVRMIEVVAPVWENARRLKRNTTLGWRGRRTNGSQPKSE